MNRAFTLSSRGSYTGPAFGFRRLPAESSARFPVFDPLVLLSTTAPGD